MEINLNEIVRMVGTLYIETVQLRSENARLSLELTAAQERGAKLERMIDLQSKAEASAERGIDPGGN